jgi:hypothetical protein
LAGAPLRTLELTSTKAKEVNVRLAIVCATMMASALAPSVATAQTDDRSLERLPRWELGTSVGVARHSLAGRHLGLIPDRDHLFVSVDLTVNLVRRERWAFGLAPEVLPLVVVSNNPRYRTIEGRGIRYEIEDGIGPVAGAGISPIAIQGQLKVSSRVRLYAGGAAGAIWFTRDVPVVESRAFNYTFEFGGGLRWQLRSRESLRIGWKFHHLSNAYSARQNPGLDAAVVVIGYSRTLGASDNRH